jgi:uncharacterized protein YqeY
MTSYQELSRQSLEKLPPANIEAEQRLLSALLMDPRRLPEVQAVLALDDFYRPAHRHIFTAIRDTHTPDGCDLLVLRDALQKQGKLQDIGGPAYLAALVDAAPSAANAIAHATLVHEKAMARKLLHSNVELATRAYDDREPARDLIRDAKAQFESLWRLLFREDDIFWRQDAVGRAVGIETDQLLQFLIEQGFYMLEIHETVLFVRNLDNILQETVWVKSVNKTVKDYLKAHVDAIGRRDVWRVLVDKSKLFSSAVLTGLDTLQGEFYHDDPDTCTLFFQNGVLEITAARVAWKPYSDVSGYLWEDQISEHDYTGRYNRQIESKLRADLHRSLKSRDQHRVNVLRRILNRIQYYKKDQGHCYDDDIFEILLKMSNQAGESLEYAIKSERNDRIKAEDRELELINQYYDLREREKCEYQRFLELVSQESIEEYTGKTQHVNNLHAFEYALAYLVHGYNHKANMRAVVLADSNPSFVSNGRRGKGVILQALKHIKGKGIVVKEDGKAFNNGQFKFQLVRPNTRILILDDVAEDFDFAWLYSAITDAFVVESKGFKRIAFDFEDTPRFVITTNHPCYDEGVSSSERAILLPVGDYFTATGRTPYQEFGNKMLFDDWDQAEWDRFFDYFVEIIQRFLQRDDPSVIPIVDLSIFNANKLLLKVPEPMVNYLDALKKDHDYERLQIVNDLEEMGLKFRTSNEFNRLLHTYCRLRGYKLKSNTKDGRYISNGIIYINLQPVTPDLFDAKYQKPQK